MAKTKLFVVQGCHSCPNVKSERNRDAGYAEDYTCMLTSRVVASYVEWERDKRLDGDFPPDCPLTDGAPTDCSRL